MLCRFLMSNGFVDLGVEALADRVDWLQAVGSQGLLELADAELQPLDPGLINAFGLVFEHVPQVVEHRQQAPDQVGRCMLHRLQLLLAHALLVVVEVGGEAKVAVTALSERRIELGDLAFERGCGRLGLVVLTRVVRMLASRHRSLDTARDVRVKRPAQPCAHSLPGPRPANEPPSGCTPCGSGRSRQARLSSVPKDRTSSTRPRIPEADSSGFPTRSRSAGPTRR